MMNSVALKAPLAAEPMLDALRALSPRPLRTADELVPLNATLANVRVVEAALPAQPPPRVVTWAHPDENLWLLSLKNFGLTLATFGVYHFWGRAEARRQTVNAVHVNGTPVDYTGTGKEAFISFVMGAMIATGIVSAFLYLLNTSGSGGGLAGVREIRWQRLTISLPLMFLLGSVVYRKRQHILRRTWIGGQRFDLSGHAWSYAWQHFWTAFLVPLTFGLAAPWRASRLEARKIAGMHHGDFTFRSETNLWPLYRSFAWLWAGGGFIYITMLIVLARHIGPELLEAAYTVSLLPLLPWPVAKQGLGIAAVGLVPLALLILTYRKTWLEHQISSIAFNAGRLRLQMPLGAYLWLSVSNTLMTIGSLGAFAPVAEARYLHFVVEHLTVDGDLQLGITRP